MGLFYKAAFDIIQIAALYIFVKLLLDGAVKLGASVLSFVFEKIIHGNGIYILFPKITDGDCTTVKESLSLALKSKRLSKLCSVCVSFLTLITFIIFRIISEFGAFCGVNDKQIKNVYC